MDVEHIRKRLQHYEREAVHDAQVKRAAVAIILQEGGDGSEFLVIQRAHRDNDPWSGHMALPGGRHQPEDVDLYTTVARETREEVGIDLDRDSKRIGCLDDLQAMGGGRRPDLVITPFVCTLDRAVFPVPDPREVQSAMWVPLGHLRSPTHRGRFRSAMNGTETDFDAFLYRGHVIWGLTYRILHRFLDLLD
jgi:8-oxo-dGTP pyrophosphatase MutT (NUDIX family)